MSNVNTKKPNHQMWDTLYQDKEDFWTQNAAYDMYLELSDTLTQGKTNQNILVPLCGRSKLMLLLAEQGHTIVGIEGSKTAIVAFFEENEIAYQELTFNLNEKPIPMFQAKEKPITIYCGDLLAFKDHAGIGPFDCIQDHGSVRCFATWRSSYAAIMNSFTKPEGKVLLSIFDYDHSEHPSIPFTVSEKEVNTLFKDFFTTIKLQKELDAETTANIFHHDSGGIFPVLKFSQMSWKIMLLEKN